KEALPSLIHALEDADQAVRYQAAFALARVDPQRGQGIPVLIQALADRSWLVRVNAVRALGELGQNASKATPALVELLRKDSDLAVRTAAARTLARSGPAEPGVVAALAQSIKDKEPLVSMAAIEALGD